MKNNLKQIRKSRKLTQQQMADTLGVKINRYRSWERGVVEISGVYLLKCADILDCSLDDIAGHEAKSRYRDRGEEELHRIWAMLDNRGRTCVLEMARGQLALGRTSEMSKVSSA